MPSHPVEILLVEDNAADVRLAREILAESGLPNILAVVPDGVEALAYLRREAPYAGVTQPAFVLLDLNTPRKSGHEVLAELKRDPVLRRLPVVVFTTSSAERDVVESYDLHANCYITKPVDLDRFTEVLTRVQRFWFSVATLAPVPSDPGGLAGEAHLRP